ncbi:MAG: hypothetical protein JKY65_14025 [Planctomycetes bacterium]|nr:hypothetical protein [Planctomycetota bacterium]
MKATLRGAWTADHKAAMALIARYGEAVRGGAVEEAPPAREISEQALRQLSPYSPQSGGLLVLHVDGALRGVVGWRRSLEDPRASGLIVALAVEPGAWEAGLFEELLAGACEDMARAGCDRSNLWIPSPDSPALFAARSIGFVAIDAAGFTTGAWSRFQRELPALGFARELIRLAAPRFLLGLVVLLPFMLVIMMEALTAGLLGFGLALAVLPPTLAEVWLRRRVWRALGFGVITAAVSVAIGVAWVAHANALSEGGLGWVHVAAALNKAEVWAIGVHWAPFCLAAGVLPVRVLGGGLDRLKAFACGNALMMISMPFAALAFMSPANSVEMVFGLFLCAFPACWVMGTFFGLLLGAADGFRDRVPRRLELHYEGVPPA